MKLPIQLSNQSRVPIYHQIEEQMKALIASGQLQEGTKLPSIRALSKDLEVSVITTRRAYQNLEQQGFIMTKQGKGTFVANVAETMKTKVKDQAVEEAFREAIDVAKRHNYTDEEIQTIFQEMLKGEV
ncbi:GntR family transcriptional regulator [Aliibacillus thermotolerans]|uniref:GntR family transcriptional regulator n=1 Tax=Aliibacillus thermotolerans TaxID=1834418 RepID=A0ABW0U9Z1_9BACI|nr:GntR family transcriptional regulator [Aliibacillus thermotolerans]MDA3130011.1 GntR family transcriptional regulator [Aliibacillus thermotolerans]